MSALIDQSSLENDKVTVIEDDDEVTVIEDIENTISYYANLCEIQFLNDVEEEVDFDELPEWLLKQDMEFLDGLLTIAQMTFDDKNTFLNKIADLNELSDEDATERREILLESVARGG